MYKGTNRFNCISRLTKGTMIRTKINMARRRLQNVLVKVKKFTFNTTVCFYASSYSRNEKINLCKAIQSWNILFSPLNYH
jgi:hypothetical protein